MDIVKRGADSTKEWMGNIGRPNIAENPILTPSEVMDKYSGLGKMFKAKMIGSEVVSKAKGEDMCHNAMRKMKEAVKMMGTHKPKVQIRLTAEHIKILDLQSAAEIYKHSLSKITYVTSDPTDVRAFGYVYGEKEGPHTFFGIKTERAAIETVYALKEVFEAVSAIRKQKKRNEAANSKDGDNKEAEKKPEPEKETKSATSQPEAAINTAQPLPRNAGDANATIPPPVRTMSVPPPAVARKQSEALMDFFAETPQGQVPPGFAEQFAPQMTQQLSQSVNTPGALEDIFGGVQFAPPPQATPQQPPVVSQNAINTAMNAFSHQQQSMPQMTWATGQPQQQMQQQQQQQLFQQQMMARMMMQNNPGAQTQAQNYAAMQQQFANMNMFANMNSFGMSQQPQPQQQPQQPQMATAVSGDSMVPTSGSNPFASIEPNLMQVHEATPKPAQPSGYQQFQQQFTDLLPEHIAAKSTVDKKDLFAEPKPDKTLTLAEKSTQQQQSPVDPLATTMPAVAQTTVQTPPQQPETQQPQDFFSLSEASQPAMAPTPTTSDNTENANNGDTELNPFA